MKNAVLATWSLVDYCPKPEDITQVTSMINERKWSSRPNIHSHNFPMCMHHTGPLCLCSELGSTVVNWACAQDGVVCKDIVAATWGK